MIKYIKSFTVYLLGDSFLKKSIQQRRIERGGDHFVVYYKLNTNTQGGELTH